MRDDELAARIEAGFETAGLDRRRLAMLSYAAKLTRHPWEVREDDVLKLRAEGFNDEDVLAIVEVVAYYAFVNRIADGLGVALEADEDAP